MNELVRLSVADGVATITIDNPPVNALGERVSQELSAALDGAFQDASAKAILIVCAGRTFIAGADIKQLEDAATGRGSGGGLELHPLLAKIENSPKPVVVGFHGTALGGGVELAMSAHYRVATERARIGQPEVNLGIIPGAEGTQRLPRLVGVAAALDMCVSGKPITAPEALRLGLIDRIIDGDDGALAPGAAVFAREMVAGGGPHRRTCDRREKLGSPAENAPLFAAAREQAAKIRRNQTAPLAAIEAIEIATTTPFDEGCRKEREIAVRSLASEQARAMMHAFFAERATAKIPGISKDAPAYPLRSAAIVGAGTMGGGIAMCAANAGLPVRIRDADPAALERGMATIRKNYEASVKKGRYSQAVMEERLALIHPQLDDEGFDTADIIIEAVFENMALKKQIFATLDRVARKDCVLASNTSTLDIDEIASATSRPEMVIGLHFFSPAHIMRLVEIVRGSKTRGEVTATALAAAKKFGKTGVVVGNCRGFVGNRMMFPYMREAQFLVEEGATPGQVDGALTAFGMAMGIFAVDDMGGIDVAWRVRQEFKHLENPNLRAPLVADKLVAMNRLGQKTGAGWYRYDENRKPAPDPEIETLIRRTAQEAGIPSRSVTGEEIIERCLYAMINEGARILEEGYALRAGDIDTIYLNGYGFPSYRGGPMWYADTVGLSRVAARIQEFERRMGELWTPAPLLMRLAAEGGSFAAWDAAR
jgi:3-hydroxyacyl-CoA dehydrogenase